MASTLATSLRPAPHAHTALLRTSTTRTQLPTLVRWESTAAHSAVPILGFN